MWGGKLSVSLVVWFSFIKTLKSRVVKMNREQIITLWLYNRHRKIQQKNRNKRIVEIVLFSTLFGDLRNDENKFFNYFLMLIASLNELHGKLQDTIQR